MACCPSLKPWGGEFRHACVFEGEGWLPYDFMREQHTYTHDCVREEECGYMIWFI